MMVTYEFYLKEYYGDVIPASDFQKYAVRADDTLDHLTNYADIPQEHTVKAQKARCALAELEYRIDDAMKNSGTDAAGRGKIVKSVSSGNESVSYDTGSNVITSALTDSNSLERLRYDTVRRYLGGTGLLYWGCDHG